MIESFNEVNSYSDIISKLEEINPGFSTDEIKDYIEKYLLEQVKTQIIKMNIPRGISVEKLRIMRASIRIRKRSGRWVRKIDNIIKNYQRNLNYLKFKNIKDSLIKWKNFSEYNDLSSFTNGSNLIYIDNTNLEYNGNKKVSTGIDYELQLSDHDSIYKPKSKQLAFDSKTYEKLKLDTPRDIGTYTDSLRELEKLDKIEKEKKEVKIPLGDDLLEKIREIQLIPMEKKEPKFVSIKDFKKHLDDIDSIKEDFKETDI